MERGIFLQDVHSNNEAEYAALCLGLEWCESNGITHLNVYGDSMLIVKQTQGIWACKSDKLAAKLCEVKGILKRFTAMQVHYIARGKNQLADALASEGLKKAMIGAIKLQEPKLQGKDSLQDIICFLEMGEAPSHLTKGERRWLARKAVRYRLINEDLYCLGKDQIFCKVPPKE